MNGEISPTLLLTMISFGLSDSIVTMAALFDPHSGSVSPPFYAKDLSLIAYAPRTVLATTWPSVILMTFPGRTEDTNRPSLPNDIILSTPGALPCRVLTTFDECSAAPVVAACGGRHERSSDNT